MNGTKLLLDTNVVLYYLSGDQTIKELLNGKNLYVSFITELELLGFRGITEKEEMQIELFLKECNVVNITEQIKEQAIKVRKSYQMKLPDSIISATSSYLGIPLLTADTDFNKIVEIDTLIYEL